MQQRIFRAMGCQMLAVVDQPSHVPLLAEVPVWFEAWEQILSRFRPNSELCLLNQRGWATGVSSTLWAVVQLALAAAKRSNGLVTPTELGALQSAGYDRSFEQLCPGSVLIEKQEPHVMWPAIICDPASHSIQLPPGAQLDLGGFAKGWAADQAVQRLAATGPALVDAGGDIATQGRQRDGSLWPIAVADPRTPDQELELLLLSDGGVATSGRDYRRWQHAGRWQHHLIDPRTHTPADTDVLSATVIGPSATTAEQAAKYVVLLGSKAGLDWLTGQPNLAGLLVTESGAVRRSPQFASYCWDTRSME